MAKREDTTYFEKKATGICGNKRSHAGNVTMGDG